MFLNGKSQGRKHKGVDTTPAKVDCYNWPGGDLNSKYRLRWDVPYEPRKLEAIAYTDGKELCKEQIVTAGAPAAITVTADSTQIAADGDDASFVTAKIVDSHGNFCPLADNPMGLYIVGNGELLTVGNGNAASTESCQEPCRKAFNGMCLAIVRAKVGHFASFTLNASADGLDSASIEIVSQ